MDSLRPDESKMYPITANEEVYPLEQWLELVEDGIYTIEDGAAHYANETHYRIDAIYWNLAIPPEWATHVVIFAND